MTDAILSVQDIVFGHDRYQCDVHVWLQRNIFGGLVTHVYSWPISREDDLAFFGVFLMFARTRKEEVLKGRAGLFRGFSDVRAN